MKLFVNCTFMDQDPTKFAVAVAAPVSGESGGAVVAVAVEEEAAEESDGDMGFDLFD